MIKKNNFKDIIKATLFTFYFLFLFFFIQNVNLFAVSSENFELIPRKVIVLYNQNKDAKKLIESNAHRFAEMPLNYLGLVLEYHRMSDGLPEIVNRKDVRGVLTWFNSGEKIIDPNKYLKWAIKAVSAGKKFVIIGTPGFLETKDKKSARLSLINRFLHKLGLKYDNTWIDSTYNVKFIPYDNKMIGFESNYPIEKAPFNFFNKTGNNSTVYLSAKVPSHKKEAILVTTSPNGGYIAPDYAVNIEFEKYSEGINNLKWFINPFYFFEKAFDTKNLPAPSVTTLAGRRIYFSHIDGDGWNNYTQIEKYKHKPIFSSLVILENAIKPYPELPVTVGPIMAELDKNEKGTNESRKIAKEFFNLDNVEVGSHTYTHPLEWSFFKNYNRTEENKRAGKFLLLGEKQPITGESSYYEEENYLVPRSYFKYPFNLENETFGSKNFINNLINNNKKCKVLLWSGACTPYEKAIELSRKAGLKNLNGGDTRFDSKYPSYLWVCPVGAQVGNQKQIYAAASNENTYTNLWTSDFFGFKYLTETFKNTESPIRVKPMNLYYHMYSGEKEASLKALIHNLEFIKNSKIIPITTSNYCGIADSFFSTKIYRLAEDYWLIKDRDLLETIRIPNAIFKSVDFSKSKGIIGQIYLQGSLYIYLDSSVPEIYIKIKEEKEYWKTPKAVRPYLIESRWQIYNLVINENHFSFEAKGFGKGEMKWYVPKNGTYSIYVNNDKILTKKANDNLLNFSINKSAINSILLEIRKE